MPKVDVLGLCDSFKYCFILFFKIAISRSDSNDSNYFDRFPFCDKISFD
jgi:hypothetical protein